MSEKTEIEALIRLLDDEDESIVQNVSNRLIEYGEAVVFNLENSWESTTNQIVHERIENLIHRINFNVLFEDFKKWNETSDHDLFEAVMLIAKYQFSNLDNFSTRNYVDGIKQKIWLELNNDLTPLETVSVFNQVFFGQFGFTGNYQDEPDINDYCLNYVVESKKGAGITIGILYIVIAQELNIPIYGVNLFNHFVLSYQKKFILNFNEDFAKESLFYINPVNKGAVFGRQDIVNYLKKIKKDVDSLYFKPSHSKELIKELLIYIKVYFAKANKTENVEEINALIDLI